MTKSASFTKAVDFNTDLNSVKAAQKKLDEIIQKKQQMPGKAQPQK